MERIIIKTVEDVKVFFQLLHNKYQVAFHPDDDFKDYVSIANDERTFTNEEADYLNKLMNVSFEICERNGVDIYLIGLEISHPDLGKE